MRKFANLLIATGLSTLLAGCGAKVDNADQLTNRPQDSIGWNSIGWNSIGWNSIGWNGIGWTGTSFANPSITPDWGLDPWINDPAISVPEREARLLGVAYWTGCACDATDHLAWSGTDPSTGLPTTRTFDGAFGLAPTWCHGTAPVPTGELEAVSACLFARINNKGIHNALSIRGSESSLRLVDNEKLFMAYPEGQLWGNLFDNAMSFQDPASGFYYKNTKAYACYFPTLPSNAQLLKDLGNIIGRTCEVDGCGGGAHTALACFSDGNTDGAKSLAFADPGLTMPVGYTYDPITTSAGPSNSYSNGYQDWVTGTPKAVHYNNSKRRVSVFLGAWADLETGNWKGAGYRCDASCAPFDGCACYDRYCDSSFETGGGGGSQVCEAPSFCNNCQTVVRHPGPGCWGADAFCKTGDCVRNHKLVALAPACWLPIQFTRPYDVLSGGLVAGVANMHKAGTLSFRYAHVGPGPASILLMDNIRGLPIFAGGFAPTGSHDIYSDHTIYPIYPGRAAFTGALPGIEISLAADPAHAFPELDYAQIHIGPPFGQPARELYWEKKVVDFNPGDSVCLSVTVDNDTDFSAAGDIRVRPDIAGVSPQNLDITVAHNGVQVSYALDPGDAPWSNWIGDFAADVPNNGTWDVCINNAPQAGTISGVSLEMKQR